MTTSEKIQNTGDASPGVSRLGLPSYEWWNEGLHGVAQSPGVRFASSGDFSYATSFPQPITMGAAFDMPLISSVARKVALLGTDRDWTADYCWRGGLDRGSSIQQCRASWSDLLDSKHQPVSRSSLGPRTGGSLRRPVPHQLVCQPAHSRASRRSPSRPIFQSGGDVQTLRRLRPRE